MKVSSFILIVFFFFVLKTKGISQNIGTIKIKGDIIYLDSLIDKNISKNKINKTISGYRIQLFSGNERNNANNIKTKFLRLFPEQVLLILFERK